MKTSMNIFLGILGAAAAGVVVGMLIAPEKGEDLRSNIKESASDLIKKLNNLITEGKDQYDVLKSSVQEDADELRAEAASAFKRAKSTI